MIALLLQVMGKLGGWLVQRAPLLFAYKAGSSAKQHDFDEAIKKVLEEDNEELRANNAMPDVAIADKLRDRAKAKRKD